MKGANAYYYGKRRLRAGVALCLTLASSVRLTGTKPPGPAAEMSDASVKMAPPRTCPVM